MTPINIDFILIKAVRRIEEYETRIKSDGSKLKYFIGIQEIENSIIKIIRLIHNEKPIRDYKVIESVNTNGAVIKLVRVYYNLVDAGAIDTYKNYLKELEENYN